MAIGGNKAFYGNLIIILTLMTILKPMILKFIPISIITFVNNLIIYYFICVVFIFIRLSILCWEFTLLRWGFR